MGIEVKIMILMIIAFYFYTMTEYYLFHTF